ncbi:MAG: hypothetical protein RQ824_01010 [bacterium]|nr:hypothetical protein [bacterium]
MKKKVATIIGGIIIAMAGFTHAQMDHSMRNQGRMSDEMMNKNRMEMKMPGGMEMHAMEIKGHKVNFHIMDKKAFRNYMDTMGHKDHSMKEGMSHYVLMDITDPKGMKVKSSKVKLKVIGPDKKADEKTAFPMMGDFGAEFDMSRKGKYQIMTLFQVKNKKHHGGFWHEIE